MMEQPSKMKTALALMHEQGTLRPRDLARRGIPPDYLDRLYRRGLVARVARRLLPGQTAGRGARCPEHPRLAALDRTTDSRLGSSPPETHGRMAHVLSPRGDRSARRDERFRDAVAERAARAEHQHRPAAQVLVNHLLAS